MGDEGEMYGQNKSRIWEADVLYVREGDLPDLVGHQSGRRAGLWVHHRVQGQRGAFGH